MGACYSAGDWPLQPPPDVASTVASIAKKVKVRISSKELRPLQTTPSPASSTNSMDAMVAISANFMALMMDKAEALDACKNMTFFDALGSQAKGVALAVPPPEDPKLLCGQKALPAPEAK